MLFNQEEKNMMVGAFVSGGLSALMNGYFAYRLAGGTNVGNTPTDPAFWLYSKFAGVWVPNLAQIIPWFGVPGLMWYFGKKKGRSKLRTLGIGGLIFGVSEFVALTAYNVSAVATGNMSYRVVGGVVR